jgi:hypothetical protein
MVQKLMLALTLLFATTWLLAQDPSSQTAPPASSSSQSGMSSSSGSSGQTSVEGCLQGSNGSFTLTDKAGTTYQLSGDTSKLAEHVGHEVQITGTTSAATAAGSSAGSTSSSAGSAGSSAGSQMLTVEKVKHVSKTCKEAGK